MQQKIMKIYQKAALKVVNKRRKGELEADSDEWTITEDQLEDYIGKRVFTSDRYRRAGHPRVSRAWFSHIPPTLYQHVCQHPTGRDHGPSLDIHGRLRAVH